MNPLEYDPTYSKNPKNIGNYIKKFRKEKGLFQELEPSIKEQKIALQISKLLEDAFRKNLRIILVTDELSTEQKDTMNNVIRAFRLENGESIQFKGYVVRLEQKINLTDGQTEYAISVQQVVFFKITNLYKNVPF